MKNTYTFEVILLGNSFSLRLFVARVGYLAHELLCVWVTWHVRFLAHELLVLWLLGM